MMNSAYQTLWSLYRSLPQPLRKRILPLARTVVKGLGANVGNSADIAEAKHLLSVWQLEPALLEVERVLDHEPSNLRALQLRVTLLMHLGRLDEARDAATILGKLHPLDVTGNRHMRSLGVAAPEATREHALSVVKSSGKKANTLKVAAAYLYDYELFEDCIEFSILGISAVGAAETAVSRRQIAEFQHQIALALEGLERYDEALHMHQTLLTNKATARQARAGIARCWLEIGQPQRSEDILTLHSGGAEEAPFSPLLLDVLQAQGKVGASYRVYRKKPISIAVAKFFRMPNPSELNLATGVYKKKSALFLSEGGPGDELRLCSVYSDLSKLVGDITITSDPRLAAMMSRSFPNITFLSSERHRREVARVVSDRTLINDANLFQLVSDTAVEVGRTKDLVCSVLDTLADVRPSIEAFKSTGTGPRLLPLPDLQAHWASQMSGQKTKIGIAWRSMLQSVARNRHYFSVEDLAALAGIQDAEFWLLQPLATQREIDVLQSMVDLRIPQGLDLVDDLEGQLALVCNLDAVLSPFTTTGELAGAAGTPTVLVSTTRSTTWRAKPDGTDVFSPNTLIVSGLRQNGKSSAVSAATQALQGILDRTAS